MKKRGLNSPHLSLKVVGNLKMKMMGNSSRYSENRLAFPLIFLKISYVLSDE